MVMDRPEMDIARLVADFHQPIYRYAYRLTGSVPEAEDLTQEVFLIAQQKLGQLRQAECAQAWLFRILRNHFLKSRERRRRQPASMADVSLDENLMAADVPPSDQIDRQHLQEALNRLPDNSRIILLMFYFEGRSYREIADELHLPIGTVMSRLARAKRHLRSSLLEPSASGSHCPGSTVAPQP